MYTVARDAMDATLSSNVRFRSRNKKANKTCLKMSENGNRAMLTGCLDDLGVWVKQLICGAGRSTTIFLCPWLHHFFSDDPSDRVNHQPAQPSPAQHSCQPSTALIFLTVSSAPTSDERCYNGQYEYTNTYRFLRTFVRTIRPMLSRAFSWVQHRG